MKKKLLYRQHIWILSSPLWNTEELTCIADAMGMLWENNVKMWGKGKNNLDQVLQS